MTRPSTLYEARERFTRVYLLRTLEKHKGNVTHAASEMGIDRPYLYALMRKYRLKKPGG